VSYALVAVPRAIPEPLLYGLPAELAPLARPGVRARVPLRGREVTGLVVELRETTELDPAVIRPVVEILDPEPLLPGHLLKLAGFIAEYYRCPLGETLAAMLPAGLLRADAEEAELTAAGAAADPRGLPPMRSAILRELQERGRARTAFLLAHAGAASREPLKALIDAGLVRLRRRRRDRPPRVEVAAVRLPARPLEELLEACKRAPRQREILERLATAPGPMLVTELCAAVGCTPSVVRAMVSKGVLERFTQAPAGKPAWALRSGGTERLTLTAEQAAAVEAVVEAYRERRYAPFLLHGVTGSGKTEVYLRCLESVIADGRTGLVLVPEIGLTPAAVGAVERRFGERVAVLHSAQSEGERWRQWRAVHEGRAGVVVGPRSALFAPLPRLGLVVVDEEQDPAYKQGEAPRDLALVLAKDLEIPVLLCSATPSVEAHALVARGLARRLVLGHRVAGGHLPDVELVDLRKEPPEPGEQGRTLFSTRLRELMEETMGRGEQVILLIQRRGWAPILMCRDCGHRTECPECSIPLVLHRRQGGLRCHYCGYRRPVPETCPHCGGTLLDAVGAGTEKVAHHLARHFPGVRAGILDRDTVRRRNGLEEVLGAFSSGRLQVLVGTQMVAKGHHFPNVTLTGVISADSLLGLPDFRAGERTFQLLTQVAGRSGRGERPGRVLIQTYYPDHPAVRHASDHDVESFNREELTYRQAFQYPPAVRMALVRFESASGDAARDAAEEASRAARPLPEGVRLRGPAPAPLERLRGRWRWQILVSAPDRGRLRQVLERVDVLPVSKKVHRIIDVDPLSTL